MVFCVLRLSGSVLVHRTGRRACVSLCKGSVECVSLAVVFLCSIPWLEFTNVGKSRADLADIVVSVGAS